MSTTPVPVSAENDLTNGATSHVLLMMVAHPDLWECAAPMNHGPGSWAGRHSLTSNVKFNEQRIVLDGHDQGPLLRHLPFDDPYRSLKSNRKTVYAASRVRANGTPMACTTTTKLNMIACGDPVSLPLVNNVSNQEYTLYIGLAADDELKGDIAIAVSIITDVIAFAVACATANPSPVAIDADGLVGDFFGVDPVKTVVGANLGLAASIITSGASGWKDPIVYKVETGNGFRAMTHEVSYDPSTGEWAHKGTQNTVGIGKSEYGGPIYTPAKAPSPAPDAAAPGEKL
jgi:hypothetical protein